MSTPAAGGTARLGGRHHLGIVAACATLLASAPLFSLYESWNWLFQCVLAVAMIAAAAAGARTLRAPAWVQTLAMLAALALSVTWQFPSGEEWLLLPTAGTLRHFSVLLGEVPDVVASQAIPVADHDGLLLLTVVGVGLVAIMVDLATVAMRRPAIAGLPMLAIYSVPVAVHKGSVPALAFLVGAVGYLWLVATDNLDRVRRFGRRFTGDGRDVPLWEPSPLAAAGRRLTVVGALIAVMLPLAVPGMTTGLVDRFGSGVAGSGGSGGNPTAVDLFANLDGLLNRDTTEELIQLTTDDPDRYYLRIGVADEITEEGFGNRNPTGDPVNAGINDDPPDREGVTLHRNRAQVEILSWNMSRAPTFAYLDQVSGLGDDWRYDPEQQVVFSPESGASGSFEFEYLRPEFDPDALRNAAPLPADHPIQEQFAEVLPEPAITELVAELTDGVSNPYDQVLAILSHFSRANGFRYSLETGPETTGSAIVDFVIENKLGYCVQYASAMAWLVREAGLPSRVAVGFTRGSERAENTYILTNHNLHAWTEVYFEGFGWVPFDPTPSLSIAGSAERSWAPDPDRPDPSASGPAANPGGGSSTNPEGQPDGNTPEFAPEPGGGAAGAAGSDGSVWRWWVLGAAAALLALLVAPALRRIQLRRRRAPRRRLPRVAAEATTPAPGVVTGEPATAARHQAHAAWDELLDTMIDFQVPLDPAETPRTTATRLVRECRLDVGGASPAGDGARLLGQAEERARYAPSPMSAAGLLTALRAVRRALAAEATRRTRWRARLLPPSTLLRWRMAAGEASTRAAAATGRLGELGARLSPRRRWLATRG
jgi:transglutaminase-like putative cysteine protease